MPLKREPRVLLLAGARTISGRDRYDSGHMNGFATLRYLAPPRRAASRRAALAAMLLCAVSLLLCGCATTTPPAPAPRPDQWATPVEAAGDAPIRTVVRCSCTAGAEPTVPA